MKFIIDAHLPRSLSEFFKGHNVLHTSDLKDGNFSADRVISTVSLLENRALITKDSDFYYSYVTSRRPYKLVLVKLGNMRIKELKDYFRRNSSRIIQLLGDHSFLIIELDKIRVLD